MCMVFGKIVIECNDKAFITDRSNKDFLIL